MESPQKLTGVICMGDSLAPCTMDGLVESDQTISGDQFPDRSHLKRSSSEGNVDDTLDILGVQDSPPLRECGRKKKKKSDNGNADSDCSDRIVALDSDQVEGANGVLWHTNPQPRTSLLNENSNTFDPGPTSEAVDAIEPIDCFKLFMTDQMMDLIISATNASITAENSKRTRHIQPVVADEFSAMLGLVILSGALQNNHLRTKLLFDSIFCGEQFRATMPSSRFSVLLSVLSFENSETVTQQSSHNKFIPISKLWNSLIENCGKCYVPGSHVTIGKQIVPFRGVICMGDSLAPCTMDGLVESDQTISGDQFPDRSHLKRSSSEGNVDDTLDILGVQDSPPLRECGRKKKKKSDNGNADSDCSDRIVALDSDQVEGANGVLWHTNPQPRTSLLNENSNTFDPGPTSEAVDAIEPIDCFKLFMTDQMMDLIISATNASITAENSKRTRHIQPVVADEFSAMLGLVILSGALQNNHLRTKLLFDSIFCGEQFRATMPYSRFSVLLSVLSFENSETVKQQSSHNKFIPISKLWNSLIENCGKCYVPGSHVTIGKQIVPFRGNCPFIVTTHSPVRHGIQLFHMVDNSSKYIINAFPYLGKNTLPKECPIENFAVNCLVEPVKNSFRILTMDEWFTSISLAEELLSEAKLKVIGRIKNNNKALPTFFSGVKYKQRKAGSSIFLYSGNVMAVSYKPCNNTGLISLISTCHNGQTLRNSSGKPQIVLDYEATREAAMNSSFENNFTRTTTMRKTYRWPTAMFYLIIDVAVQNSYIIYHHNFLKHRQDPKAKILTKLDFALSLVRQMCNPWMRARLEKPIPGTARAAISHCLSIKEVPGYSAERDQPVMGDKCQLYCSFCPPKTKRKSRWLCGSCKKIICIEHNRKMCVPCWENLKETIEKMN